MGTTSKVIEIASPRQVFSVTFTRDRKHIFTGDEGRAIRRWDAENGRRHGATMEGDGCVMAMTMSVDGRWIVTGSDGNKVTVWNASTHDKVLEITGHTNWVRAIDVSNDSKRIATGSHDHTVQLFNTTSGKRLLVPLQHSHIVLAVKFSPDDSRLATATHARDCVRVYDSHSGEKLFEVAVQIRPYHRSNPFAWSSDSQRLFTVVPGKITALDLSNSALTDWPVHNTHSDASLVTNGSMFCRFNSLTVGPYFAHSNWPSSRTRLDNMGYMLVLGWEIPRMCTWFQGYPSQTQ